MKQSFSKLAAAAAMAVGMAFAQTPAAPAQPRQGRIWAQHKGALRSAMLRQLNLTDAQKQQAKTILQQAKQSAQPLREQLRTNRQALAAAVKANDVAQIHSLSAQQGNLQGQLLGIRSEARAKVYATLSPEQKAKAGEMRQKVRERIKQRMEQRKENNG
jgi:Spy/CpxP family protein refolding chaperone